MTPFIQILSKQVELAKHIIEKNNYLGNTDGLLANFSLRNNKADFVWKVNCANTDWTSTKSQSISSGTSNEISSLGFSLYLDKIKVSDFGQLFSDGMKSLKRRDPFPEDRVSFVFYPKQLMGIALGAVIVNDKEVLSWLKNEIIPNKKKYAKMKGANYLIDKMIEAILFDKKVEFTADEVMKFQSLSEASLSLWGAKNNFYKLHINDNDLRALKESILEKFLVTNLDEIEGMYVPFILSSVLFCIQESVNNIILDINHVSKVLENFEAAMERWVWRDKNTWKIESEKDIQSILWLILRSYFEDVVYEDPTQKFGQGSSIVDVKIPSLNLIVEAKFVKDANKFDKVEDEIKIDSIDYVQSTGYKNLIVFIYDSTSSVQFHATTKNSLKQIPNIKDVIIVSKPSHIK